MFTSLLKKVFWISFTIVIIQLSYFTTMSLLANTTLGEFMYSVSIYDVKTITIGNYTETFYIINIKKYITSMINSIVINFDGVVPSIPSTIPKTNWADLTSILKTIVNALSYLTNWLVFTINLTLIPIKWLLMPVMFLISILGIDLSNTDIYNMFNNVYTLSIPYIPYLS